MVKEKEFTIKEYKKLLNVMNQSHMRLVKWLYEKYPKVWHRYENEKLGGLRLKMLK